MLNTILILVQIECGLTKLYIHNIKLNVKEIIDEVAKNPRLLNSLFCKW